MVDMRTPSTPQPDPRTGQPDAPTGADTSGQQPAQASGGTLTGRVLRPGTALAIPTPSGVARDINRRYVAWGDKTFAAPADADPWWVKALRGVGHYAWSQHRVKLYPVLAGAGMRLFGHYLVSYITTHGGVAWYWWSLGTLVGTGTAWAFTRKMPFQGEGLAVRSAVFGVGLYCTMLASAAVPLPVCYSLLILATIAATVITIRCQKRRRLAAPEPVAEVIHDEPEPVDDSLLGQWSRKWDAEVAGVVQKAKGTRVVDAEQLDVEFYRLLIQLTPGVNELDGFCNAAGAIAQALHLKKSGVNTEEHPTDDSLVYVKVRRDFPLKDPVAWDESQAPETVTEPLWMGLNEVKQPFRLPLLYNHMLVLGTTRWGKSNQLSAMIANLTKCRDEIILMIDLKGGAEARLWAPNLFWVATTPEEAKLMLAWVVQVIKARPQLYSKRKVHPTRKRPHFTVIVDESNELTGMNCVDKDIRTLAEKVATQGAGMAVSLVMATQYGSLESLGSSVLRSNLTLGMCFRTRERADGQFVFDNWMMIDTSKIAVKGQFYCAPDPDSAPQVARGPDLSDDVELAELSLARAAWRRDGVDAPEVEATLASLGGEVLATRWDRAPAGMRAAHEARSVSELLGDDDEPAAIDVEQLALSIADGDPAGTDPVSPTGTTAAPALGAGGGASTSMFGDEDVNALPAHVRAQLIVAELGDRNCTVTDLAEARARLAAEGRDMSALVAATHNAKSRNAAIAACDYIASAGEHGRKLRDIVAACGRKRSWVHARVSVLMKRGALRRPPANNTEGWYAVVPGVDLHDAWARLEAELPDYRAGRQTTASTATHAASAPEVHAQPVADPLERPYGPAAGE